MKNPDEEDRNARYLAWTFNYRKVKVSKRYQILPDLDIVLTIKTFKLQMSCYVEVKVEQIFILIIF